MKIISVDLASRRYRDIGVVVIGVAGDVVTVEFEGLGTRRLGGTPSVASLAPHVVRLANDVDERGQAFLQRFREEGRLLFAARDGGGA